MKVRLLTLEAIDDFVIDHANSRNHFQHWMIKLKTADWDSPLSITQTYSSNLIGSDRVVFDIGGNGRNAYKNIAMKYTVIKTKEQYKAYCKMVMDIAMNRPESQEKEDEMELIEVLIDKWEAEHIKLKPIDLDPIQLLKSFMVDHKMKQTDLVGLLEISKSAVSQILNYKKGLSKEVIRKLCDRFKVQQETFNRPYKLKSQKVATNKSNVKKITSKKKKKPVRKAA